MLLHVSSFVKLRVLCEMSWSCHCEVSFHGHVHGALIWDPDIFMPLCNCVVYEPVLYMTNNLIVVIVIVMKNVEV